MGFALGSPFDVSGAAHLPAASWRGAGALSDIAAGGTVTLIRLEGIDASVTHRARTLAAGLKPFAAAEEVDGDTSRGLWRAIRDVAPFAVAGPLGAWPVWRIVCPPASGPALGQRLARETGGDLIYDWGGGLIWAALPPSQDAYATTVRGHVHAAGGHATLIRAPQAMREIVDVFHPLEAGLAALSARVKAAFDPSDVLNRGRLARAVGK
jgi:glycolate oxidase FAD binding subunit